MTSSDVLYEVFVQRQYVPHSFWEFYPEVEKPEMISEEAAIEHQELETLHEKMEIENLLMEGMLQKRSPIFFKR